MEILIKPIVTEQMTELGERYNRYGFMVKKKASKAQIKEAVEAMYGVTVEKINTAIYGGKRKTRFTKSGILEGRTSTYKKAIVTLAEGDTIDFYSNV